MITVKHKNGSHTPNWGAVLYCYRKLLFARRVKITVLFSSESVYTVDKPTFFKVCGWKSKLADGALDKSVRECLLAYKLTSKAGYSASKIIDFYRYSREGKGENKLRADFFGARDIRQAKPVVFLLNRTGFWPAFPWAGGNATDEAPNNDFQYQLKIERA